MIKKSLDIVLFFILSVIIMLPVASTADDIVVVYAGRLMAVPGDSVKFKQSIIIRNGKIDAIKPGYIDASTIVDDPKDSLTLHDLKDTFVMPGLIDGHVHVTDELGPKTKLAIVERSDADTAMFGIRNAQLMLDAGFTTIRDLGARGDDAIFALRDAINMGFIDGPRIFVAGHTISPTGGHGQRHGYRDEVFDVIKYSSICDGVADCRRAVREQVRRSADQIKLVATGGVLSETAAGTGQQFFDDELKAIIDTSHALGRKVTAHAHGTDGINAALRAGVDSIEHATFADKESFRLFRQTGAYLVPTLLAGVSVTEISNDSNSFFPASVRHKALQVGPRMIENVRRAHKAGVKIAFGTDSYVSNHGLNAREFELLVAAGLTPLEAIKTATVNGADNLGKSELLGSLEVGKYADLIAVDEDPTVNISALRNVDFVMKEGKVFKGI
ncbi:amidohydrolase family protein [Porticoccaceae bacterium]|nr:amidohydrolase family protein [Porticoccaceae bacterium]